MAPKYATALENMTVEPDESIKAEMRKIVMDLQARRKQLTEELRKRLDSRVEPPPIDRQIEAAMQVFDDLRRLSEDADNLLAISALFQQVDVQLFLRFEPVQLKKRIVNRLSDGIITMGAVPPPIQKYSGATSTARVEGEFANQKKNAPAATAAGANSTHFADEQVKSSRNVSRDDRTPLELFLAGLCGWDSILRRHFPGKIGGNTLP